MIGHRICEPGPGTLRCRQVTEVLDNFRFHGVRIDIAHCDHRHQIGPVPVTVETAQRCRRRVADDFQIADRTALGVAGFAQQEGDQLLVQAAKDALVSQAFLFEDDAAFFVYFLIGDGGAAGPVLDHLECGVDDRFVIGGKLQEVDGLFVGCVGVHIPPEGHTDAFEVVDQRLFGEALGAVEHHVFEEVGQPQLVVILLDGTGVDDQHQGGAVGRFGIVTDVVGQPVIQLRFADAWVHGQERIHVQRFACEV